jgi:hypothetical protein
LPEKNVLYKIQQTALLAWGLARKHPPCTLSKLQKPDTLIQIRLIRCLMELDVREQLLLLLTPIPHDVVVKVHTYDGEAVSLYPSIGNWSFRCQSHYWIQDNQVRWAGRMSAPEIEALRARERMARQRFYGSEQPVETTPPPPETARVGSFWTGVRRWFRLN